MKKMMMLAMTALTVAVSNAPALVGAATTGTQDAAPSVLAHSMHVIVAEYANGDIIYADITYVTSFAPAGTDKEEGVTFRNYMVDGKKVEGKSYIF